MNRRPGSRTRSMSVEVSSKTSVKEETQRVRRVSLSLVKEETSEVVCEGSNRDDFGKGKVLLRDWLLLQANENRIPGLEWMQVEGQRYLRIPWVHGSKASWTIDDCKVFESWAKYTGKFWSSPRNPKKWKANFRCAINSLPDVREIKSLCCRTGLNTFKVYQFLPEQPRKHRVAAELKRRAIIPSTHSLNSATSSLSTRPLNPLLSTKIKEESHHKDEGLSNLDLIYSRFSSTESSSILASSFLRPSPSRISPLVIPVVSPSSSLESGSIDSSRQESSSSSLRSGLLPLYVSQMRVDDDDDDNDNNKQSNYTQCEGESEKDNSSSSSDDDDDDDDDTDNDCNDDKVEFCSFDKIPLQNIEGVIVTTTPGNRSHQLSTISEISQWPTGINTLTNIERGRDVFQPIALVSHNSASPISSASLVSMSDNVSLTTFHASFSEMEPLELSELDSSDFAYILEEEYLSSSELLTNIDPVITNYDALL